MYRITQKRNNQVSNYLNHTCKILIDYCINNKIGNLIIGNFSGIKNNINIGRINNQNFVQIPFGILKQKLRSKCELYGIWYRDQEESYTSKCSFIDSESIEKHDVYLGKRIKRGLFKTSTGKLINADINAAANILKKFHLGKSKQNLEFNFKKLSRGCINQPVRIRVLESNFLPNYGACLHSH